MIRQVRLFLQLHRASRFDGLIAGKPSLGAIIEGQNRTTYNRAGYWRAEKDAGTVYYFETEVFPQEVSRGFDHIEVLKVLKAAGYLIADSTRNDKQIRLGPNIKPRFYAVSERILYGSD
jgi:hypothetical protein